MSINHIFVFGAGGHAKVVLDALDSGAAPERLVTVFDADPAKVGTHIAGRTVAAWPVAATVAYTAVHVAIGSGGARGRTQRQLAEAGARPMSVAHPRAVVSPSARIGDGSFVAAQAVVGPEAALEDGVIVNHGAVVDHDCFVGAFSHIAPNATLGGAVRVGANVLVGAGATILPGVSIGDGAVIAAGATVPRDVAPGEKVIFALIRKNGTLAE